MFTNYSRFITFSLAEGMDCSAVIVYYFSNKAKDKSMNLPLSSHLQTAINNHFTLII